MRLVLLLVLSLVGFQALAASVKWRSPLGSCKVRSNYGNRIHPIYKTKKFHEGVDLVAGNGTKVFAAAEGTVIFVGSISGYGKTVKIQHKDGSITVYSHLKSNSIPAGVKRNRSVTAGQQIGRANETGNTTGAHLHFEYYNSSGRLKDPMSTILKGICTKKSADAEDFIPVLQEPRETTT